MTTDIALMPQAEEVAAHNCTPNDRTALSGAAMSITMKQYSVQTDDHNTVCLIEWL